jgi:hypothetical protein
MTAPAPDGLVHAGRLVGGMAFSPMPAPPRLVPVVSGDHVVGTGELL